MNKLQSIEYTLKHSGNFRVRIYLSLVLLVLY